jgi:hypothetical protein
MPRPTSKSELLAAMTREYEALMSEIATIGEHERLIPGACDHWSVKDILGHLDAWHEMFLVWEQAGAAGEAIEMPAPGYSWKETPVLNDEIFQRIKNDGYDAVMTRLEDSHGRVRRVLEGYTDSDLSTKRRYGWTGSTSVLSYAVSATSSHYDWARKLIRRFKKVG